PTTIQEYSAEHKSSNSPVLRGRMPYNDWFLDFAASTFGRNMAGKRLTVVISQSQGRNPAKRRLEEELAAALLMDREVEVSLVPHLYDMAADHSGLLFLRGVSGPIVFLSWLSPRAARWTLDRQGVKG